MAEETTMMIPGSPPKSGYRADIENLSTRGQGSSGSVALSPADTWVQIPDSPPEKPYSLIITKENSDGTIRFSYANDSNPSVTYGNKMRSDDMCLSMGANQVFYVSSTVDGDDMNWTAKIA